MVTNKFSKKTSKKLTGKIRYKIEKKVREHNRKVRKETTAKNRKHGRKSRKDPGVPNLAPFKDKVIQEAEEDKQRAIAAKEQRKRELQAKRAESATSAPADSLSALVEQVQSKTDEFQAERNAKVTSDGSAKAFYKDFKKVVEEADVIIEVLDARDPLGCRSAEVERTVMEAGSSKQLVLLLNKADLVPKDNLLSWIKYLRDEFPVVAFKASTQRQSGGLSQAGGTSVEQTSDARLQTQCCVGASTLLQLLANYSRHRGGTITAGLVGLPNVGKSSVCNSLKRARACGVGAAAGVTRAVQRVKLDSRVQLLDSPGLVLAAGGEGSEAVLALRNAVQLQRVEDPELPVRAVLQRVDRQQLQLHYRLPAFSGPEEFLGQLARRQGRLLAGGVPDRAAAARIVLHDWNTGRIRYHTEPPQRSADITLVSRPDQLFNIDQLSELQTLHAADAMDADTQQDADTTASLTVDLSSADAPAKKKQRGAATASQTEQATLSKKAQRQLIKKQRKLKTRTNRKVNELTDEFSSL